MTALSVRGFSVANGTTTQQWFQFNPVPSGTKKGDLVLFVLNLSTMSDVTSFFNETAVAEVVGGGAGFYLYQASGTDFSASKLMFVIGVGPLG